MNFEREAGGDYQPEHNPTAVCDGKSALAIGHALANQIAGIESCRAHQFDQVAKSGNTGIREALDSKPCRGSAATPVRINTGPQRGVLACRFESCLGH